MKRFARLAVLLFALATPAFAAPAPASVTTGKITITGDSFVVDDVKHLAVFTGNVVVIDTQMTLTSDKVVATYGAAGASSIKTFEATGHVKIVTKEETATGEKAVFDPTTKLLTLSGNVLVDNASGQVQGQQLVVNLKKNTSVFTGGNAGGRVTGVFTSQ